MMLTVGSNSLLPYWLHKVILSAGVSHRSMYTGTNRITIKQQQSSKQTDDPPKRATCLTFDKSILFFPCKHIFCCEKCSKKLDNCPICRTEISEKIKVYY